MEKDENFFAFGVDFSVENHYSKQEMYHLRQK